MEQKTRDQHAATEFLTAAFGFSVVGPEGPGNVRILVGAGKPVFGGVMAFDDRYASDQSPFWLLYVEAVDVDAAVARAAGSGGSPWFAGTDTPLGPLAYVRDPAGHAIALVAVSGAGRTMIS